MKKIISAALAASLMLSGISAMASGINITIDNEEFIPKNALGEVVEPFIENGSTFLPVRAMGEAVGKEVSFDAENYAVYIGEKPTKEAVEKEPYALIDDTIYYEGDLPENLETAILFHKAIKLAEQKFTKEDIDLMVEEKRPEIVMYLGDVSETIVKYYACCQLFLDNTAVPDEAYNDFVTVKHILAENKEKAFEVIEKLEKGADFDELIEEYNIDPGQTKDSSYTFTYGEMVKQFENAAFELKEGEYTKEPVGTDFGYHIIKRLPLNKEEVDTTEIILSAILEELEGVEVEKTVLVTKGGDYGEIEGVTITTKMLDVLDGVASYNNTFSQLVIFATLKKACIENDLLTEEGMETAKYYCENPSEIDPEGELAVFDKEQTEFIYSLLAYYVAATSGQLNEKAENFDFDAVEVDSKVYKQLKVFVDGKLIVPCDVNENYVAPINKNGTVYVPVRAIVEALGMTAAWDNDTRTVVINK